MPPLADGSPPECGRCRVPAAPAASKHGNRKIIRDGLVFASGFEYERWCELQLQERAGAIRDLRRQVEFEIRWPATGEKICSYIADAVYVDETGLTIVEDAKGHLTEAYKLKRKLVRAALGISILEVRRKRR